MRFLRTLRAFRRAKSGNVAIIFGLSVIPVIGFVGSAVDYSRASSTRAAMQSALDATALMLSKTAVSLSADQVSVKATDYFLSLLNNPDAKNIKITATYSDANGSQILLSGTGAVNANFMGLLGYNSIPLTVNSTVKWGTTRLRVALALDNTGSMSRSNKMPTLKTAAKNLLTQLQNASRVNGDVYVSIVPFAKDVNVGSGNFNTTWVDFKDHGSWQGWTSTNGSCNKKDSRDRTISNRSDCLAANGKWTASTPSASNWAGCVTDRDQDYDTNATNPNVSVAATLYPAETYSDCPVSLMPLSYDWTALKNKIDAMQPAGNTNITIGLVWAWQTLTNDNPFPAPAKSPNYEYQDVIILLTDGENTQNRFTSSQNSIDARTKAACTAAKNAKITMYTVLVMEGTQSLLQNCASDTSKYFYITSADQLITTFDRIGTSLSNLRIAN
ncbi:MAG TPA: pilus assembly protein [Pseudolabrys sp.]|nr:pilus assembly protein [Pseudolabrys sp.]